MTTAGALMAAEISEQPELVSRLLDEGAAAAHQVAKSIAERPPRFVLLAARGTSDHAALYAKYLLEVQLALPCGLVSPSTFTSYGARPDLRDVLLVAVSQSGGSPDLVETTTRARTLGAMTLAVTNAPGSDLAESAELHLAVLAGPERAVAATKSYSAELLALWLLVQSWRRRRSGRPVCCRRACRRGVPPRGPTPGDRRPRVALPLHGPGDPHRPRLRLRDGAGGGAEADGDLLRRGPRVQRGGPAARSARDDRPEPPGRRGGPRRRRRHRDAAGAGADERA